MNQLDRPGRFRANATQMGLYVKDGSNAVQAIFDFGIVEMWDQQTAAWMDWPYDQHILGYITIVKSDGSPNNIQVEALMKNLGWSGDLSALVQGSPFRPEPCQITVDNSTYEGKTSLKVNWVNGWNDAGGQIKCADEAKVKALAAKHGSSFRALKGNLARNATPAKPTPATPPPRADFPPEYVFDPNDPAMQG